MSLKKLQQCGQSSTHDGKFSYSPAMIIAAMVLGNIELSILSHISLKSLLNPNHNVVNRLKIG